METDKEYIRSLSSLSDEALREKIKAAAEACGIDGKRAAAGLSDMRAVRKKLDSLSDAQIKAIISAVGEENLRKIRSGMKNGQ